MSSIFYYKPWVKTQRLDVAGPYTQVLGSADVHSITKSSSVITGTVRSLNIAQTMTAAATTSQVEALKVQIISDVKTGAWANAIVGSINYSTSGAAHGMAAAVCAEMIPPNSSLSRGSLYALDMEFGCGASSSWGSAGPVAFWKMENWGTKAYFSENAFLFHLLGETSAGGALWNDSTLRIRIGSTTKYLVLSNAEDSLTISGNLLPGTDDGAAIGSTALQWSDLFLADGAVINWNDGAVTLTGNANDVTLTGGGLAVGAGATGITIAAQTTMGIALAVAAGVGGIAIDAGTVNHAADGSIIDINLDVEGAYSVNAINVNLDFETTGMGAADVSAVLKADINELLVHTDGAGLHGTDITITGFDTGRADLVGHLVTLDGTKTAGDTSAAFKVVGTQVIDHSGEDLYGVWINFSGMTLTDGQVYGTYTDMSFANGSTSYGHYLNMGTASTAGISINGTAVSGVIIPAVCTTAVSLTGANATSIGISGNNTSASMLISGTWGSSANYGAITLAGDAAGTALALGTSATSLIGIRIDLTGAVTAGNDFMAMHSELETSAAMVDGFIIGTYQRVRIAHVAYENYAIWGRMDVNVAQTGDTGNQYLGVFGAVNFAAGAHALLATGGGYGVLGTASIASGGTIDQPLIGGYFEANAVDTQSSTLVTASRHRMLGYCNYGIDILCQTSNGLAMMRMAPESSAKVNAGLILEVAAGSGVIQNLFKLEDSTSCCINTSGNVGGAQQSDAIIKMDVAGTAYYLAAFLAGSVTGEWNDI